MHPKRKYSLALVVQCLRRALDDLHKKGMMLDMDVMDVSPP